MYRFSLCLLVAICLGFMGCESDMENQPRLEPLEANTFFADHRASRPVVEHTIARGQLQLDTALYEGKVNGEIVNENPMELTPELLARGKERYRIFCSQCHDQVGNGNGMVVQRGFPRATSYHSPRLREAADGYYFDVITNGFGRMPDLKELIPPKDRWAIVAYIRALQLSQYAPKEMLTSEDLKQLK